MQNQPNEWILFAVPNSNRVQYWARGTSQFSSTFKYGAFPFDRQTLQFRILNEVGGIDARAYTVINVSIITLWLMLDFGPEMNEAILGKRKLEGMICRQQCMTYKTNLLQWFFGSWDSWLVLCSSFPKSIRLRAYNWWAQFHLYQRLQASSRVS